MIYCNTVKSQISLTWKKVHLCKCKNVNRVRHAEQKDKNISPTAYDVLLALWLLTERNKEYVKASLISTNAHNHESWTGLLLLSISVDTRRAFFFTQHKHFNEVINVLITLRLPMKWGNNVLHLRLVCDHKDTSPLCFRAKHSAVNTASSQSRNRACLTSRPM